MELAEANHLGLVPVEIEIGAITSANAARNVAASLARRLPRFHQLQGLGSAIGPVAIVGGGPSLAGSLDELRAFGGPIISCGTVYDYLVENGIIPTFHVDGEPDADGVMWRWLKYPQHETTYLIASQCPPNMFETLADHGVLLWHLAVPDDDSSPDFGGEPTVPGGHFNLARAWPIAAIMGHRDFHFFGFDCSFPQGSDSQHAYSYDWSKDEPCWVMVARTGERFASTPHWMAQLDIFSQMLVQANGKFAVTIHGHSLAAATLGN